MKHTTKLLSIIAVTCMLLGLMGCQPTTGNIGCSHNFEKTSSVEPTCTEKGYDIYTCSLCNETEKRNIVNALGHNFGETPSSFTKATCTTKGYDVYTCSRCNGTKKCNFVNALGHKWSVVHDNSEWKCERENCDEGLSCDDNDFLVYVFENETSDLSDFIDIIVLKDILNDEKDTVKYNNLESLLGKKIAKIYIQSDWEKFAPEDDSIDSPIYVILE